MKTNIKFINVEKQGNKFICQISYKEMAGANLNGLLCYNFDASSIQLEEYNGKSLRRINNFDRIKVKNIRDDILNGEDEKLEVILNIRNGGNLNYKYNEKDKTLVIDLNYKDVDNDKKSIYNKTFLDIVKGYEEVMGVTAAYRLDDSESIGDKMLNIEIYNLPTEKIKQIIS